MPFCSIQEGFSLFGLSTGSEDVEADTKTTVTFPLKWIFLLAGIAFVVIYFRLFKWADPVYRELSRELSKEL